MSWIFGKKKTPQELLRENKRMLDRSIRELDRERANLQTQEKKLIAEIKKTAKQNQMVSFFSLLVFLQKGRPTRLKKLIYNRRRRSSLLR